MKSDENNTLASHSFKYTSYNLFAVTTSGGKAESKSALIKLQTLNLNTNHCVSIYHLLFRKEFRAILNDLESEMK